jgi:hypothetical protein
MLNKFSWDKDKRRPSVKDNFIGLRIEPYLYKQIREQAKKRGLSLSNYCRLMLTLELQHVDLKEIEAARLEARELIEEMTSWTEANRDETARRLMESLETYSTTKKAFEQVFQAIFAFATALNTSAKMKGDEDAGSADCGDSDSPDATGTRGSKNRASKRRRALPRVSAEGRETSDSATGKSADPESR